MTEANVQDLMSHLLDALEDSKHSGLRKAAMELLLSLLEAQSANAKTYSSVLAPAVGARGRLVKYREDDNADVRSLVAKVESFIDKF